MVILLLLNYWWDDYNKSSTSRINRYITSKEKKTKFGYNNNLWWIIFGDMNEWFLSICSSTRKSPLGQSSWSKITVQKEFLE